MTTAPGKSAPTLIVAGGGTGGHVLAGVAIADAWKLKHPGARILFVGARGGIEEKLVPRAGYTLELLSLGSLKGVSTLRRMKTLLQLPLSFLRSAMILTRSKPEAVIGVGGYASGPLVLFSRFLAPFFGTRVAILEQNAVPGLTNRILSRFAHRVLSAFPGMEKRFPAGKLILTGNPVRKEIRPLPRSSRDPFTIFVFGGSQGSVPINGFVLEALPILARSVRWIHQTGERDYERVAEGHRKAGTDARVEKFIHDMPMAYGQASVLLCRAGSSTLAEIAAVRRAAILIPFPQASDNHQELNARGFSEAGAAVIVRQSEATGVKLAALINELKSNPARLDQMEDAVGRFYRPDAASAAVEALSRS